MARSLCTVQDCDKIVNGHGLCYFHYERVRDAKDPMPEGFVVPWTMCTIEGCERWARSRGLCSKHYSRWGAKKSPTLTPATCQLCGNAFAFRQGGSHRGRYCSRDCANKAPKERRHLRGPASPRWKGGRHFRSRDGYVTVYVRDENDQPKLTLEHRLVMAQKLGRELHAYETVHHKNGDKADNRIKNLELRVGRHGRGATESHCPTCTCFEHT